MDMELLGHFTVSVGESPCLALPLSTQEDHILCNTVILIGPNCGEQKVEVVRKSNKIYFANGWNKFEKEQGIVQGDILFMKVFKGSKVLVRILEKNGVYVEIKDISENKRKFEEQNCSRFWKRSRPSDDPKSRKELMVEIEDLKSRTSKPTHVLEMTTTGLDHKCEIPLSFARHLLANDGDYVKLSVPGRKLRKVRWISSACFTGFGAGWDSFRDKHQLEQGDMTFLEATCPRYITINIFHCVPCPFEGSQLSSHSFDDYESKSKDLARRLDSYKKDNNIDFEDDINSNIVELIRRTKKPCIAISMTKNRLMRTSCSVSKQFFQKHLKGLKSGDCMKVICSEACSHELGWVESVGLSKGWSVFKRIHELKRKDALLLEVINSRTVKAHILRSSQSKGEVICIE